MAVALRPRPASAPPVAPPLSPRRYLWDIVWAARVTAGIALLLASRTFPTFWHQISCLIVLAVLTYPVRSVRWGTIYNFFFTGMLFAYAIVALQYGIEKVILGGRFPLLGSVLVAPTTEEIGKVLPLLILVAIGWHGFRSSYGACDLMLCGAGLGCGFALVEDTARRTQSFPPSTGPHLLGIPIFPDSYSGFLGHGASAAMIALTVGFFVYAVRWRRWVLPSAIGVLVALFWMMVDHGLANYAVNASTASWFFPVRWVWKLDGSGTLSPYVLCGLILATILAERVLLWRILSGMPRLKPAAAAYVFRPFQLGWGYPQLRATVLRAHTLLLYLLSGRRLGYLLAHWKGDTPPDRLAAPLIKRYAGKVVLTQVAVRRT